MENHHEPHINLPHRRRVCVDRWLAGKDAGMNDPHEDEEHFDDLEYDEDEDPWDLHDYEGESPESLQRWYNGRVL